MQTSQPTNNSQIAIVGMSAHFGIYSSLDAFERSVYEGQCLSDGNNTEYLLSTAEIEQRFDRVIAMALKDAAIFYKGVPVIAANNSKHELKRNAVRVDSVFDALLKAQELLNDVEVVVVAGINPQGIGAVVLKRYLTAKRSGDSIYAAIEQIGVSDTGETNNVAYLEFFGDKQLEEVNIERRTRNFTNRVSNSCAVSSLNNAGYQGTAGEIASLIKTALCLYYRYIPGVFGWQQQTPNNHSFYVASCAKPWFLEAEVTRRVAAIDYASNNARIILAEETEAQLRDNTYLEQMPCYLFPLTAKDGATLLKRLELLKQTLVSSNLAQTAKQTFTKYRDDRADLTLAIMGKNRAEILKECDRATKGIPKAIKTGKHWQTPVGSYFTPNPQGKKGKVAYVYPGAYNAHVGLGKDLFRLFPNLMDDPVIQTVCNRTAGIEKLLYPRSWHKLSPKELEAKERELMNDPLAMLESETGFAGFMTTILRDYFQVKPQAAFGYSLGETSMMYAQGVWNDIEQSSDLLNASTLFATRLSGKKEAVREYWQLSDEPKELWRTYVVMANSKVVAEKLQQEERVYLTQISTPKEVVIAGDPDGCQRVIASLGCDAFRAPFNHVIHCPAMKSEYQELVKLNTLPLRRNPQIAFYSAANYQQITHTSQDIAHNVARTLCQQLDFPRLVERVYQDNYRIFIEVGVGSNCSRWIKDILKSQEHAVVSIHRRGTNDFTSLIKAIALLVSHGVSLDLSSLYSKDLKPSKPAVYAERHSPIDSWQKQNTYQNDDQIKPIPAISNGANIAYKTDFDQEKKIEPTIVQTTKNTNNTLNDRSISQDDANKVILCQPVYLDALKHGSLNNNSHLSKAQSLFIKRDREYSLHNKNAISVHLDFLNKALNKQQ